MYIDYQRKPKRAIPELSIASMRVLCLKAGMTGKQIEERYIKQAGLELIK